MRPQPILPAGQARCPSTRAVHCSRADYCARAQAPHTLDRPVIDYSRGYRPCIAFIALTPAAPSAAQHTVHDTPEGLR